MYRRLLARPWLLSFLPVNAATAGFGVMLPLLILLRLHGTVLDVALAAVLFNLAVIGGSFYWGRLADRSQDRRYFLWVNFGAYAGVYLVIGGASSLGLLFGLYTLVGFLAPAGTSASNLLILEQFSETERPEAYASFQEMSILGSILGVLIGYFWLGAGGSMDPLLGIFAALAALSMGAVFLLIPRSRRTYQLDQVADHVESFTSRLRHSVALRNPVPFFPRVHRPRPGLLGRWRRRIVAEAHHELPLVFAGGFLFTLASNLFNTSYTPYLDSIGLAGASIFLVNSSNNVAQAIAYPFSGTLGNREGADRLVRQATYLRSLGYLGIALLALVPLGLGRAYPANLVLFGVLGGAIALYSTASSLVLFRGLEGRGAGLLLGWNSALGGAAAVLGALLSGLLSFRFGYQETFLVATALLLLSLPLWAAAEVAYAKRRGSPVRPAWRIGRFGPGARADQGTRPSASGGPGPAPEPAPMAPQGD